MRRGEARLENFHSPQWLTHSSILCPIVHVFELFVWFLFDCMSLPPTPKWPAALSPIAPTHPPPPPDSPSAIEDASHIESDEEFHINDEEDVDLTNQTDELRRAFLALANGDQSTGTINRQQFRQLLKSHLRQHSNESNDITHDESQMDAELESMWLEVPKQTDTLTGEDGVTFPSLLALLSGEDSNEPTPNGSRRHSFSNNGTGENGVVASGVARHGGSVDPLFKMFARRGSFKYGNRGPGTRRGSELANGLYMPSYPNSADRPSFDSREGVSPSGTFPPPLPPTASHVATSSPTANASSQPVTPLPSGPTASGALDLADSDWNDLQWLVAAHPAAFSTASPRTSFSGGSLPSPNSTTTSQANMLVSSSALQIAMQHYLSRWLNQHELNVIGTMQKFASRRRSSTTASESLTFDVLQKAVGHVHSWLRHNPDATQVDPLPAFAQALGLTTTPMNTDELLAHLNTFSVLPLDASQQLLAQFGGGVLHAPVILTLLSDYKSLTIRHARLEKEYTLLTAHRENLDSSHADLSEQVPFLQGKVDALENDKRQLEANLTKLADVAAQSNTHKANYEKAQKKIQSLYEDMETLRTDLKVTKESNHHSEDELTKLNSAYNKLKERLYQTETALKELELRSVDEREQDAAALRHAQEEHRTLEQRFQDLLERSQIFYRRLVAVGETDDLEPIDGITGVNIITDNSRVQMSPRSPNSPMAGPSSPRNIEDLNDSLGAELDDFARGEALSRVEQQGVEIEKLKQQLAALSNRVGDKDREIARLHGEIDGKKSKSTTPLEIGPLSDGEESTQDCATMCNKCTIM